MAVTNSPGSLLILGHVTFSNRVRLMYLESQMSSFIQSPRIHACCRVDTQYTLAIESPRKPLSFWGWEPSQWAAGSHIGGAENSRVMQHRQSEGSTHSPETLFLPAPEIISSHLAPCLSRPYCSSSIQGHHFFCPWPPLTPRQGQSPLLFKATEYCSPSFGALTYVCSSGI